MCDPQLRTPGMSRSSRQAWTEIRVSSGREVPGFVSQCMRKSRSLKSGSSDWPRSGVTAKPASRRVAAAANTAGGRLSTRASRAS